MWTEAKCPASKVDIDRFDDELVMCVAHAAADMDGRRLVVFGWARPHMNVLDMRLGKVVQVDVAEDARQPPLVLVLEIASSASLEHLHSHRIRSAAKPDLVRDVELGGLSRALLVAHVDAVDPDGECSVHALKAKADLVVVGLGPQSNGANVSAALVFIHGDMWWATLPEESGLRAKRPPCDSRTLAQQTQSRDCETKTR